MKGHTSMGSSFVSHIRGVPILSGGIGRSQTQSRQVFRPVSLAPGPRTPRRQRARLVTTNFKQGDRHDDEALRSKPHPHRHPLTEDPFSGASPAETATQEVIFHASPSAAAAAAAPPQPPSLTQSMAEAARQVSQLAQRPRAFLRAIVRNGAAYGLPLLLAYFARQPLQSFWAVYCATLDTYPLLTKIATGIVGTVLGDYIAQRLSHQSEAQEALIRGKPVASFEFDLMRTARLVIYGAVFSTPVGHFWFQLLDTRVMPEAMTSLPAVISKMAADQLIMCPLSTALLFVVMRCWEGYPNDAISYMRSKMGPTLRANYLLWPLAHIINFAFVPPSQRILYCNAVGVLWTVILSTIMNSRTSAVAATVSAKGADASRSSAQ